MTIITPKESKGQFPYLLFYGKELVLPVNIEINALSMTFQVEETDQYTPLQYIYLQLKELQEEKTQSLQLERYKQFPKQTLIRR